MHYSDTNRKRENPESNFSQVQANVCIEYMEISEDDEREIFRRVQLGVEPNYAEKMKAEDPTPRQTLVHELVAESGTPLRGFNDRRDATFRWVAQSLQTILDPRPIIKCMTTTTSQQTTWLKNTAALDLAWKKPVQHKYDHRLVRGA
ncbi:hypothetical protein BJV78DRAFT_1244935 [Lactifluus subvellereus]|nr:hypothetical protein BJV78DRAFT_1244935 [Lactifluus subvellereus]